MRIKECRICHNKKLVKIGSLGDIAISDFTDTPSEGTKYPLELVYCERCTLLQLAHDTPRDLLYKNYWYESHINPVVVKDLKEIAQYSKGVSEHIDIGANDGTLLSFSKAKCRIGVDPANVHPDCKEEHIKGMGCSVNGDFDINNRYLWYRQYWEEDHTYFTPAQLITAIACLYDLPAPNKFMKRIKECLAEDGIFISQFQPLSEMIELNDVGNICHEHLEYYSYKSLVYLFEQNGLEIFKVEKNKINGGSYRIFARHFKKGSIHYPEKEYGVKELKDFMKRIEVNKKKMINFMWGTEKIIIGFGASTKANTIMQYYGCYPTFIVDINPNKLGKHPIGTTTSIINHIPKKTSYLWVFPYGFIDYFKKKEKGYKGKWITTIPEFKIT